MGKGKNGNLRSADMLTEKELRQMASNGGKKSVEVRRQKKSMREALEMLLYDVELDEQTKERLKAQGVTDKKDFNHQMVITRSLIAKAESGDVQAYHAICSMIGEKPAEKVEVGGDLFSNIRVVDDTIEDTGTIPQSEDDIPD